MKQVHEPGNEGEWISIQWVFLSLLLCVCHCSLFHRFVSLFVKLALKLITNRDDWCLCCILSSLSTTTTTATVVFMSILIKCILQWLCFLSPCLRYIYFRCKVKTPQPDTHSSLSGCSNTGTKNNFFFSESDSRWVNMHFRWVTSLQSSTDDAERHIALKALISSKDTFFLLIFIYIFLYWNSALNLIWTSSKAHT